MAAARASTNSERVIVGIYGGMRGRTVWSPFVCASAFPSLPPPPSTRKSPLPTADFSASLFYFASGIDVLVDWNDPAAALASPHAVEELDFIADFTAFSSSSSDGKHEERRLWSKIAKFRAPPSSPPTQTMDESVLAGFPDKDALVSLTKKKTCERVLFRRRKARILTVFAQVAIMFESLVEALRRMKRDSSIAGVRKVAHSVKGASAQIG